MADYGLRVWNASGDLMLDYTDTISRLRYSAQLDADDSGNVTLSDISGLDTVQFAICKESGKLAHYVYRSGTTIYWSPREIADFGLLSGDSYMVVFLYS